MRCVEFVCRYLVRSVAEGVSGKEEQARVRSRYPVIDQARVRRGAGAAISA